MHMESNFFFSLKKKQKKQKNLYEEPFLTWNMGQKLILYDPSINFLLEWGSHYKLSHEVFLLYQTNFCIFHRKIPLYAQEKYLKLKKEKEMENGKCLENTWKVEATCTAESNTKCTHSISQFIKIEQ